MHVTLVHVQVKPERVEEFIAATRRNHAGSIAEPGNLRFDVLQDPADATHFILYEAFASEADAAQHKQTPHYLEWRSTVEDWMAAPRRGEAMHCLCPAP